MNRDTEMLDHHKREAISPIRSELELAAWLRHQEELDRLILRPTRGLGLRGTMHAVLRKPDGSMLAVRKDNGIVNNGFSFIANSIGNRAASGASAAMGWIAVGTGTTSFAADQSVLATELLRAAASFEHTTGTKVFSLSTTFAAGEATGTITEAGVFNQSTLGGTMLDRVVFTGIAKEAGDSLTQTFTFTMS
jgi:hypothetical protein